MTVRALTLVARTPPSNGVSDCPQRPTCTLVRPGKRATTDVGTTHGRLVSCLSREVAAHAGVRPSPLADHIDADACGLTHGLSACHARYARLAPTRALPSLGRPVAQSDGVMRESFMHVHAASCIPIHASCVAVPLSAAAIRLQPFSRTGTLPNARRPTRSAASQPTMKWLRRSTATPREAKAMHSFGACLARGNQVRHGHALDDEERTVLTCGPVCRCVVVRAPLARAIRHGG